MLEFYNGVLEAYHHLQETLRGLSEKLAHAEGRIERYWGVPLTGNGRQDLIAL